MDYTDFDTRLAAYAVVVDDERRILLALWNEEAVGRWTLPGGGVELEETVEQATVREVREETGYEVALGRIIGIDNGRRLAGGAPATHSRPLKSLRVLFEARIMGGALRNAVGDSTDEARWVPLAEVPSLARVPASMSR